MKNSTPTYGEESTHIAKEPFVKLAEAPIGIHESNNNKILLDCYYLLFRYDVEDYPSLISSVEKMIKDVSDNDTCKLNDGKIISKQTIINLIPECIKKYKEILEINKNKKRYQRENQSSYEIRIDDFRKKLKETTLSNLLKIEEILDSNEIID